LQRRATFERLLSRLISVRDASNPHTPLLVKIAPDLSPDECEDIASVALSSGIDGIVVSNTTTDRPHVTSRSSKQEGGLSGIPLFQRSTQVLARIFVLTKGRVPLIGVGGIASAADAYEKICAGASLVQLYSAVSFRGPMLVSEIRWGLAELLTANGFSSIQQAVGTRSTAWMSSGEHPYSGCSAAQVSKKLIIVSSRKRRGLSGAASPLSGI
jgi:dihydroorotate dehydrogenase